MNQPFNTFFDLQRAFIAISGVDAAAFLQGLITNDINKLEETRIIYTCLLDAQGKYESDFFILKNNGAYIVDCLKAHLPILLQKFKIYKLRSNVLIEDISDQWQVRLSYMKDQNEEAIKDPRHPDLGYRIYHHQPFIGESIPDQSEQFHNYRIQLGIPSYPASLIPNKTMPLEANMDELNAISWDKGCYLGQELTARTKYRGTINKRYLPVKLENGTPEIGWEICYKGEKIGALLEFKNAMGIARLAIDIAIQIAKKKETITQKYGELRPVIPEWLNLN